MSHLPKKALERPLSRKVHAPDTMARPDSRLGVDPVSCAVNEYDVDKTAAKIHHSIDRFVDELKKLWRGETGVPSGSPKAAAPQERSDGHDRHGPTALPEPGRTHDNHDSSEPKRKRTGEYERVFYFDDYWKACLGVFIWALCVSTIACVSALYVEYVESSPEWINVLIGPVAFALYLVPLLWFSFSHTFSLGQKLRKLDTNVFTAMSQFFRVECGERLDRTLARFGTMPNSPQDAAAGVFRLYEILLLWRRLEHAPDIIAEAWATERLKSRHCRDQVRIWCYVASGIVMLAECVLLLLSIFDKLHIGYKRDFCDTYGCKLFFGVLFLTHIAGLIWAHLHWQRLTDEIIQNVTAMLRLGDQKVTPFVGKKRNVDTQDRDVKDWSKWVLEKDPSQALASQFANLALRAVGLRIIQSQMRDKTLTPPGAVATQADTTAGAPGAQSAP